jgi:2-oxoisovalerate dehydrogenase E1 component
VITKEILLKAWQLMCTSRRMAELYDENRQITKYVHSTSKGHEAIQLSVGLQLKSIDYAAPYYRDESMLLGMGFTPYELMLQLLTKADDPFSGGRTYYAHPSSKVADKPKMPHQSSATGMQAIPATGMAHALSYFESQNILREDQKGENGELPIVLCSLGDGCVTEGEVSEAFQMAVLKQLPIFYLVQDNDWAISASAQEMRAMDAYEFAAGFKGMERLRCDGTNMLECWDQVKHCIKYVREHRKPILLHVKCPLLGHHTSGVRKEFYRSDEDMAIHTAKDPFPKLRSLLSDNYFTTEAELEGINNAARLLAEEDFAKAVDANEPAPDSVVLHEFAPTPISEEKGVRAPVGREPVMMVDAALFACKEILQKHPEALLYGQDVGGTLGGVFREAATLARTFGDHRVFNTPIQEAYIVGSTAGMSAVGARPIVEIQFADYIWSAVNQLVVELSKSCYLTMGKYPISSVIRVPCGAYIGGGPYHSGCIESAILSVRGIKVVYPSNAADMKGLLKSAYYDPNPVVVFEHKGLYWSKVPGTEMARTIEPDEDYVVPIGKGRIALEASETNISRGESCVIITYGMGVYWALAAEKQFEGKVEIVDLRSLYPCDEALVFERVKLHGKVIVLTEEQLLNSFAEALAGRIQKHCFRSLDAPVETVGSLNIPAVALNIGLEKAMLPNAEKLGVVIGKLLSE